MKQKMVFFDAHARNWDKKQHLGDPGRIQNIVSEFKIRRGTKVLDIGCGTGVILPHLSKNVGKDGELFALDFSLKMLKMAKQKRIAKNVIYIDADAKSLPFKKDSFDSITCFATFPHLDEKKRCLEEMERVLKSRGKIFISHSASRKELNTFHKRSHKAVSGDLLPAQKDMRRLMKDAGFKNVRITDRPSFYLAYGEKV